MATIGRGCNLDPKLINALIKRWRLETHTFYLPCGECTITLEDVQLQLGLPVDGAALTGTVQSTDLGAICYDLLGAIPHNIYGGNIEMGWLRDTFLEPRNYSTKLERIQYARAYILEMIGGYLMLDLLRNLVHLRWNHPESYIGIPTALEDIRVLLDQRLEVQFQWTPYEDLAIWAVIPVEFLQNPNIWHVKTDRVLRQFGLPIPEEPEVLDYQHRISLRQTNMNWLLLWSEYIEIWENRYDHILDRKSIIIPKLACTPDYMLWFRIHGKLYLLSEEQRHRQICVERERRSPLNPRRMDDGTGLSTAPTQSPGPSTASTQSPSSMPQPTTSTSQPLQIMSDAYPSPYIYPNLYMFPFPSLMLGWNAWPNASPFPMTSTQLMIYKPSSPDGLHEAPSGSSSHYHFPSPYGIQTPPPWVMQTPSHSLF
ncbi:hypothetical protein PVK06_048121 [Gossypium arboreum]|uniref:Aminotransferase-like plant mobile domain-containing protein n=1 Tax=Gossypium arboreum TaxID=29729 RepID=A0ABR0MF24_GOSAR|nr:hypothetical protein PVK06_048121 [Gossypium arboreum]